MGLRWAVCSGRGCPCAHPDSRGSGGGSGCSAGDTVPGQSPVPDRHRQPAAPAVGSMGPSWGFCGFQCLRHGLLSLSFSKLSFGPGSRRGWGLVEKPRTATHAPEAWVQRPTVEPKPSVRRAGFCEGRKTLRQMGPAYSLETQCGREQPWTSGDSRSLAKPLPRGGTCGEVRSADGSRHSQPGEGPSVLGKPGGPPAKTSGS